MNGYTKKFVQEKNFVEDGVAYTGKIYSVTFYLPGDAVDPDQKYFVKDGEDIDTIASKAYYEKQLSLIKTIKEPDAPAEEVSEPKPFAQFTNLKEFKAESAENKVMLRDGNIPVISMPMGKDLEKKA
jgi:hypothetical protein